MDHKNTSSRASTENIMVFTSDPKEMFLLQSVKSIVLEFWGEYVCARVVIPNQMLFATFLSTTADTKLGRIPRSNTNAAGV